MSAPEGVVALVRRERDRIDAAINAEADRIASLEADLADARAAQRARLDRRAELADFLAVEGEPPHLL